jgi:hypothetical protein
MNIDIQILLNKIDKEVSKARGGDMGRIREHVYSIKTLCELILDDSSSYEDVQRSQPESQSLPANMVQSPSISVPVQASKPLTTNDGSNGDSIFDF